MDVLSVLNPDDNNIPKKGTGYPKKDNNARMDQARSNQEDINLDKIELNQKDQKADNYRRQMANENKNNGNLNTATQNIGGVYAENLDPLGVKLGEDKVINEEAPSLNDVHAGFALDSMKSFTRGIGNMISSNGDLVNLLSAPLPWFTMMDGNIIGNAMKEFGDDIADSNQVFVPEELQHANITWGSMMNPRFWSQNVSEMIPLALEFIATGAGAGALARNGARKVAERAGAKTLAKATQTTSTFNKLTGVSKFDNVLGSGSGITKSLLKNTDGVGKLTALGESAAQMLGAGISNNLMAGGMNAMELHKQMQAETYTDPITGEEMPKYTEDEMAEAAASSMKMNALYLPVDILSWGISYGQAGKNLFKGKTSSMLKPPAQVLRESGQHFSKGVMPFFQSAARKMGPVASKALIEGTEETFQETFEEWAKKKGKSKVTGEKVPGYFDFYMSDENRATKVLSFAVGGLMGGSMNIGEAMNKGADDMLKYYDSTENLRTSFHVEDKLGSEMREFHIQNTIFDLVAEGKSDLFQGTIDAMIEKESITQEQGQEYLELMDAMKVDYEKGKRLNVAGKNALFRNTVQERFLKGSIQRDVEQKDLIIADLKESMTDGPEVREQIQKQEDIFNEGIRGKMIALAKAKANKLNLISGKLADVNNIEFVVSRDGKEYFMLGKKDKGFNVAMQEGQVVSGLSKADLDEYVNKDDAQIYEEAKKRNQAALKALSPRAREIYDEEEKENNPKDETTTEESTENTDAVEDAQDDNQEEEQEELEEEVQLKEVLSPEERASVEQKISGLRDVEVEMYKSYTEDLKSQGNTDEEALAVTRELFNETPEGKRLLELQNILKKDDESVSENEASSKNKPKPKGPKGGAPAFKTRAERIAELESELEAITDDNNPRIAEIDAELEELENQSKQEKFEDDAVEDEDFFKGVKDKKTLAELEVERLAEAEKKLKEEAEETVEDEIEFDEEVDEEAEEDSDLTVQPHPDGKGFVVQNADGTNLQMNGKDRRFANKALAQAEIDKQGSTNPKPKKNSKLGKASKILGKAKEKIRAKLKKKVQPVIPPAFVYSENDVMKSNEIQRMVRQSIVSKTMIDNPGYVVSQDELDQYLNTTIAKFQYGPTVTQKAIALNKRFKAMGVNVDVVGVTNLFDTIGVNATGYAIAATVFIDEQSWEQDELLMHEMSHIYYRSMKDDPAVKAVIERGQENKTLVEQLKKDYPELIVYYDPSNPSDRITLQEELGFNGSESEIEMSEGLAIYKNAGFVEAPMEMQDGINEEVFTNTLQGPLSKQYDKFFAPQKEFGRKVITKGLWAHLKGKSVTYVQDNVDLIERLNNGERVDSDKLFEHVMQGFTKGLVASNTKASTRGMASKSAQLKAERKAEMKAIYEKRMSQLDNFDSADFKSRQNKSLYEDSIKKIYNDVKAMENVAEEDKQVIYRDRISDLEENMINEGIFDSFEDAQSIKIKGATRTVNGFVRSMNTIARKKSVKNGVKDVENIIDREEILSEIMQLARETRGNVDQFIYSIENAQSKEIALFSKYLDKVYPNEKSVILGSMAYLMGNTVTINGITNTVNADGTHSTNSSLSMREKFKYESKMANMIQDASEYYNAIKSGDIEAAEGMYFHEFAKSLNNVKNQKGNAQDNINIIKYLAPPGTKVSDIFENNSINLKGINYTVNTLVYNLARQKIFNANGNVYVSSPAFVSTVKAIINTNRKFTSLSVIENAEGNYEPSKITNNHLFSEIDNMSQFLSKNINGKKPSFQAFKREFGHLDKTGKRKYVNPILSSIYQQYMSGKSMPSISQYFGLVHAQNQNNSLYKNSTDFTQTLEDFFMFNSYGNIYQQNMGAFADSPRKFYMATPKLFFNSNFNAEGTLNKEGKANLNTAYNIYKALNDSLDSNKEQIIFENYEQFEEQFNKEVAEEVQRWEKNGVDLAKNKNLSKFFDKGKLNKEGKNKISEFIFNSTVNGLSISEIFNPGVDVHNIIKRNKGNSSPVVSTGNKNLRIEPLIYNDFSDKKGDVNYKEGGEAITDGGMYMLEEEAMKFVRAGLGVFDLNNGLKLMNYSVERDNPMFSGTTAYFKGYTTIISEATLEKEPHLRGIYDALKARKKKYNDNYFQEMEKKNGVGSYPTEDIMNGQPSYLNVAIPMSAIKSNFMTADMKSKLEGITLEEFNNMNGDEQALNDIYDELFYQDGKFSGISGYNFGPQQVMDKDSKQSPTPVQFISSLVVNGSTQGTLRRAEEIQRLIREEQTKSVDKIIKKILDQNGKLKPEAYKDFIRKNIDLVNMDQAQRLIIEEQVNSLNHTAINDFVINTLANRLKEAGNKLYTSGTIAQQKSNYGYAISDGYYVADENGAMTNSVRGYTKRVNDDGSVGTNPLEIVLPKHMENSGVKPRTYLALNNDFEIYERLGKNSKKYEKYKNADEEGKLEIIYELAQKEALQRDYSNSEKNSYGFKNSDLIGTVHNKAGKKIGYYVRGENVIASRVPSHGPATTGVFEVIDFLSGEGNQTVVSHEFSKVIGSDLDGDSLFIQKKDKGTPSFNKALDLTVALWTSPEFREQIQAPIDFEKDMNKMFDKNDVAVTPAEKRKALRLPMSPSYNREAYNNTMISKRNIGIVFNLHRMASYLAAYEVKLKKPIIINGKEITGFKDGAVGVNSRNNNSAKLANIILDNSKYHFAERMGLNDQTINQYSALVNMEVDIEDIYKIMSSPAAKVWTEFKQNNNSPYVTSETSTELEKKMLIALDVPKGTKGQANVNVNDLTSSKGKANVIALMKQIESMNSDLMKISKIVAGHNGIENNPFVLEKQLMEFNEVLDSKGDHLTFNNDFLNNPDVKGYKQNAQKILGILKQASRIHSASTQKLLSVLDTEINLNGMNERQLRDASKLINKFMLSRSLGLNNITAEQKAEVNKNVFDKLRNFQRALAYTDQGDKTALDNSLLFTRVIQLNQSRNGEDFIRVSPEFFNDTFNDEEKAIVQEEFRQLPEDLKRDLMIYDFGKTGLSGPTSLVHVFHNELNKQISQNGDYQQATKNNPIANQTMNQLMQIVLSNEMMAPNTSVPNVKAETKPATIRQMLETMKKAYPLLHESLIDGKKSYFSVTYEENGKPVKKFFYSKGMSQANQAIIKREKVPLEVRTKAISDGLIESIQEYVPLKGDYETMATSIADNTGIPPVDTDNQKNEKFTDEYVEAMIRYEEYAKGQKKSGNANKRNAVEEYHKYSSVVPLTRAEYDLAMQHPKIASEGQKEAMFQFYLDEKEQANELAKTMNVTSKSDKQLLSDYEVYGNKDRFAWSVVTTPIVIETANRSSREQSGITKQFENGEDVGLIQSYFDNNNIASNHPATQALVRKINNEYKSFIKERGKYIKEINDVTEALYTEKFGLSNNKFLRAGKKVFQALFGNRTTMYEKLYGGIVEKKSFTDAKGEERSEFKLLEKEVVNAKFKANEISQAEYDFYNMFRGMTSELLQHGSPDGKVRRDYIPHAAMSNFEMFSSRGLLGLMVNSKGEDSAMDDVKVYYNDNGKETLMPWYEVKNLFNVKAKEKGNSISELTEFRKLKKKTKELLKSGNNEDGSPIVYSGMQTETVLGLGPMSRFANSRSTKAELMPSMDLNKALVDYVHATVFANGNGVFKGFKEMMPLIDGVMAYNDSKGYKNAMSFVKSVYKDKFINKRDQDLFGKKTDKVINGLVKGNLLYALGYKGLVVGKGLYAVGNIAIGKYMNIKRDGGKAWLDGELRYWGTDQGYGTEALSRRRRAKNILTNLGFMEIDMYDDVSVEKKSGIDGIFTSLALLPMSQSENWIQRAHFLGLLSEEQFNKFDEKGNYKDGETQIPQETILALEERVKQAHGKGYTPVDQSRIQTYAIGRMFMQFSRHIPTNIRERFAKEDVDVYGKEYIGSLRQMYSTAEAIFTNKMSPAKFKEYYATLKPHEKNALDSALRGMAMMAVAGFVDIASEDSPDRLSPDNISRGAIGDANIYVNADKLGYKLTPPVMHSMSSAFGF